jgi:recombinational DNA repair protein (RecF pathway)
LKSKLARLIQIAFIIIILSGAASAEFRCRMCGQSINGTYYKTSSGEIYCESCWKSHSVCSKCGNLVLSVIDVDGVKICRDCYARLERCSICGSPLVGNYTEYSRLGLKVCSKCEREKPRCQNCGVPLKDPVAVGGILLCQRCAGKVERCHCCGEPLLGNFTFFEGNKSSKYCDKCVAGYPRCDDCGAPSGPDATKLDDGRYLCPDCRRIAYFEPASMTSIKTKVQSFVIDNMGMSIDHQVNFSLEGQGFIKQKAKNIHGDINGLFYRRGDEFDIYVLYGLREKDLISVIAHETSHAWQAENCPDDMALEDQEGFAQWVAYKALKFFNYDDFAGLMTDGDDPYARGLSKMLKIESNGGARAVFDAIKSKTR